MLTANILCWLSRSAPGYILRNGELCRCSEFLTLVTICAKVKSILDPCGDENDELQEDDVSLGADSMQQMCGDSSSTDTEVSLIAFFVIPNQIFCPII